MKIKVLSYKKSAENVDKEYIRFKDSLTSNSGHEFVFALKDIPDVSDETTHLTVIDDIEENSDFDLIMIADPYCVVAKNIDDLIKAFSESECFLGGIPDTLLMQTCYISNSDYKTSDVSFINCLFCFINPKFYNKLSKDDLIIDSEYDFYDNVSLVLSVIGDSSYCFHNLLLSKETPITLNFDFYAVCFRKPKYDCDIYYFDIMGEYDGRHLEDKEEVIKICKQQIIKMVMVSKQCVLKRL